MTVPSLGSVTMTDAYPALSWPPFSDGRNRGGPAAVREVKDAQPVPGIRLPGAEVGHHIQRGIQPQLSTPQDIRKAGERGSVACHAAGTPRARFASAFVEVLPPPRSRMSSPQAGPMNGSASGASGRSSGWYTGVPRSEGSARTCARSAFRDAHAGDVLDDQAQDDVVRL